jgi:hypothetical protein
VTGRIEGWTGIGYTCCWLGTEIDRGARARVDKGESENLGGL